ncbi:hypothetical protein Patl1_03037 [Pistacia atlantica]|uniref:Uncharacterized protein n=1 Tax=Pistacia atlantica TaxID=434234 RepID=A0ACC1CB27_9ROSI|nr:hypothetical protein Patl1_03037 [Pistacia atlantica]
MSIVFFSMSPTFSRERNSSAYSWFIVRLVLERVGFKCLNSSNCDVIINGPAHLDASSLKIIKPNIKYKLDILLPMEDGRPILVDLWMSLPAYELEFNGVPRTVLSTSKMEDLELFLDFSIPIMNSTEQVLKAFCLNSGTPASPVPSLTFLYGMLFQSLCSPQSTVVPAILSS